MKSLRLEAFSIALSVAAATPVFAQRAITTPLAQFGHNIGDDYFLANYTQMVDYWRKLDRESDRMRLVRIGTTAEGRPMLMAIITSPANQKKLPRYQEISRRLALAEGLTDAQARALAAEGKAVVWIDGGLHASEVLGAQQLIQTTYELVSRSDPETLRFLRDDIILLVPANPDGQELVSNWYMREPDTLRRSTSRLPRLYHKYVGHDNNRDAYMASQPETQAMDSILFRAWYPQIMYNHHQTGPIGTVIFAPPFRDPFNYNFDPLVPMELDLVGAAMHSRFVAEGKPGATMRSGSSYSTWWNGGMRTTVYFHNMIGLLTEAIGNPTPMEIPLVPEKQLPRGDLPMPIAPQKWHFAQSIAYELTANRAVLDVASRYRETLLYNIYQMGRNSIRRGNSDTWTITPKSVAALQAALPQDSVRPPGGDAGAGGSAPRSMTTSPAEMAAYNNILHNPAERDPRGYIIPADQPDFPTATKFVNALIKTGISVLRATSPFSVGNRNYPAGSFVIKTAQAFRPHILDMFEPQDHPNDFSYPGGPPIPPYDNAGWTLAYQMGVQFDRILEPFSGPFATVVGFARPLGQQVGPAADGYVLSHSENDAFVAVNRLLAHGEEVFSLRSPLNINGRIYDAGTFFIRAKPGTRPVVSRVANEKGLHFDPIDTELSSTILKPVKAPRIALYDQYGGLITSGWARFVLEQFEFPYEVVYPSQLDAGNLASKYDVLILPDGVNFARPGARVPQRIDPEDIPEEYRERLGNPTVARTIPQLLEFLNAGGTILAVGSATDIGIQLQLPIANALVDSSGRALPRTRFYVPGSILSMRVDTTALLAQGMRPVTDFYYDNAEAFRLLPAAEARGVRRIVWIDNPSPLRSGWAWGQRYLNGVTEVLQAPVGKGMLVLYGADPYFRSQPHGTFKLLFNGLLYRNALGD
ncbi:MAG TPA: M14 metallopeptidase family protein [Gemmatimonadaceae bacterium]|nr:M14 metallopeptidase family protein [Gemmatimonadaceae bacterium]